MKTFGGPLLDSELDARSRYAVSLIVGLQARAMLRREPDNFGAMLAYIVAEAAAMQAQRENES